MVIEFAKDHDCNDTDDYNDDDDEDDDDDDDLHHPHDDDDNDDVDDDEKSFGDLFDSSQPVQCPLETNATVPATEIDLGWIL